MSNDRAPWGGNPANARVRQANTVRPVSGGGGDVPPSGCRCPMAAAVHSARRGKFRLARRYAAMSGRIIVRRYV